jgi:hypothetical protein
MEISVQDFHNPKLGSCNASGADMQPLGEPLKKSDEACAADLADSSQLGLMIASISGVA